MFMSQQLLHRPNVITRPDERYDTLPAYQSLLLELPALTSFASRSHANGDDERSHCGELERSALMEIQTAKPMRTGFVKKV